MQEIKISANLLPETLYHLVPKSLFLKFTDKHGNYDCRNKVEWGKNSNFIHTATTKKQLKERVADINWANYPLKETFLLLEINRLKIDSSFTYVIENGTTYYHIWGNLPNESFSILDVARSEDGKFLI